MLKLIASATRKVPATMQACLESTVSHKFGGPVWYFLAKRLSLLHFLLSTHEKLSLQQVPNRSAAIQPISAMPVRPLSAADESDFRVGWFDGLPTG